MIDSQLRPWLVEVNHLPSFGTDSPFDFTLKQKLVHQAMNLCKALPSDKSEYDAEMLRRKESTPEAIRARLVEKITEVVTIVAPHRLPRLDALLLKHHGEEERLLGLLKTKHAKELAASEGTVVSPSIAIPSSPTLDATKVEAGLTSAASSLEDDPMVDADNSSLGDPGGSPISDSAAAVDTERAEDYEKIWPLPDVGPTGLPGKASLYRKLLDFALDQEDRRRKRFMAPLKKYAGTTPELPPVVAARRTTASCDSNNTTAAIWGNSTKVKPVKKWKPPPMPSTTQSEAASRLAGGRSSVSTHTNSRPNSERIPRRQSVPETVAAKQHLALAAQSFEFVCDQLDTMQMKYNKSSEHAVQKPDPNVRLAVNAPTLRGRTVSTGSSKARSRSRSQPPNIVYNCR